MSLNLKTFQTVVSDIAAAVQAVNSSLNNFNPGSVLLAIAEAVAGVVMWLQSVLTQLYAFARASTASGSDLDSWMADFNFIRLPAVAATGQVTFARYTPTAASLVPVGAVVETADGTQLFTVIADTNNVNYSASQNGYPVAINTGSVSVTVQAQNAGTGGNVNAATINTLTSPITGIDYVTNASAFTNGINAESDAAFRVRFQGYLGSLGQGTKTAIGNAIIAVQQGLTYSLTEQQDYNGTTDYGYFYVVVDDGSGSPPGSLLTAVNAAIDLVRPCGIRFGVFGPSPLTAIISMTITTASGFVHATVAAQVQAAIIAYVNALSVGATLPYTILAEVAYGVAGVIDVTGLTLNSGTADLVPTAKQVVKTSSGNVTIT